MKRFEVLKEESDEELGTAGYQLVDNKGSYVIKE
jgi:hypothetical protein